MHEACEWYPSHCFVSFKTMSPNTAWKWSHGQSDPKETLLTASCLCHYELCQWNFAVHLLQIFISRRDHVKDQWPKSCCAQGVRNWPRVLLDSGNLTTRIISSRKEARWNSSAHPAAKKCQPTEWSTIWRWLYAIGRRTLTYAFEPRECLCVCSLRCNRIPSLIVRSSDSTFS